MKGKLIVIDGPEGGGKDSVTEEVLRFLKTEFPDKKFKIHREPGGTVVGEEIRNILLKLRNSPNDAPRPKPETLLYFAARGQLVETEIWPLLASGVNVLLKRWYYASLAYQCAARDVPFEDVMWLKRFVMGDFEADLSLLFDLDPIVGLKRKNSQAEITRFEQEDLCFHNLVRIAFLDMFNQKIEQGKGAYWQIVNAETQTQVQVVHDVYNRVVSFLKNN